MCALVCEHSCVSVNAAVDVSVNVCVQACGAKTQPWVLCLSYHFPYCWAQDLSFAYISSSRGEWMVNRPWQPIGFYLLHGGIASTCHHTVLFTWIQGIEPRSLCLRGRHFTD